MAPARHTAPVTDADSGRARVRLAKRVCQAAAPASAARPWPLCSEQDREDLRGSRGRADGASRDRVRDVPGGRCGGIYGGGRRHDAGRRGDLPQRVLRGAGRAFEAARRRSHAVSRRQHHVRVDRAESGPGDAIQGLPGGDRGARSGSGVQPAARAASSRRPVRIARRPRLRRTRRRCGHFIYGIVGDIANTASRIEQLNKRLGTRLLSTEEVVSGIDDILVRPLGDYQFAGKRASVSVVEVLCPIRDATMAQLSLCARFRLAVEAFREDRLAEAESAFRGYPVRLSGGRAGPILSRPAPSSRSRRHRPANEPPAQ